MPVIGTNKILSASFLTKKSIRHIAAISLTFVFFFPVLFSFSFYYQKKKIRKEVKHLIIQGIDKSRLQLLIFHKNQIEKLDWKHEKEFKFRNKMYDVIYTKQQKDSVYLWCWNDSKEFQLHEKFASLLIDFFGNNKPIQKHSIFIFQFFKSLLLHYDNLSFVIPIQSHLFAFLRISTIDFSLVPASPPPDYLIN